MNEQDKEKAQTTEEKITPEENPAVQDTPAEEIDEIEALLGRIRQSQEQDETPMEQAVTVDEDAIWGEPKQDREISSDAKEIPSEENIGRKREPFALNLENDKNYKGIRDYHKVKHKRQYRFLRFLYQLVIALVIMAAAGLLGYVALEGIMDIFGINQQQQEIIVQIPRGANLDDIAEILEQEGVVKSAKLFEIWDGYADMAGEYQFGSFVLNTEMSYEEIMTELKKYNIAKESVRVTFPEGSSLFDIAELLEQNGVCDADAFLEIINTTNFTYSYMSKISDDEMKYFKMEGYAFPDTYDFYLEDNPVSVAQKFLNNLDKKITDEMYDRMTELGLTFEEFMTLASIVQAEAITKEQMENVASVYHNRLNNSAEFPKLQADPTRVYGREIKADMSIINYELIEAYDTYESEGLPPGPICSPGLDAMMATLYPATTEYYYFCSDLDTGECYYAITLEEHNQNLRICGLL